MISSSNTCWTRRTQQENSHYQDALQTGSVIKLYIMINIKIDQCGKNDHIFYHVAQPYTEGVTRWWTLQSPESFCKSEIPLVDCLLSFLCTFHPSTPHLLNQSQTHDPLGYILSSCFSKVKWMAVLHPHIFYFRSACQKFKSFSRQNLDFVCRPGVLTV